MTPVGAATAAVLAGIGGLHVAWGLGSTFPLDDRAELADAVAGTTQFPGRTKSFAVAGLLGAAAMVVAGPTFVPRRVAVLGRVGTAGVLGARGALGLANRTGQAVGWTTSSRFNRLDRRYYGPLCIALAVGSLAARWPMPSTARRSSRAA
jgi:hypothetical protein